MKSITKYISYVTAGCFLATLSACSGHDSNANEYTKRERNLINEGVKQYRAHDFRKADVAFEKAIAENANNAHAIYNSALTQLNLASAISENMADSARTVADSMFVNIAKSPLNDTILRENALYNSGNIAFDKENYQRSIEMYKAILRADTANREALENLRLAQLRLPPPQDDNQQNQGGDDNKKNQDQDQNQDKNQNQQNQEQNNNQDKQDQNNKQDQQNQDQNQDNNQGNNKPQPENQDKKTDEKQNGGMSAANAQQILDAMEKKEAATRQRVDGMKADEERKANAINGSRKPW